MKGWRRSRGDRLRPGPAGAAASQSPHPVPFRQASGLSLRRPNPLGMRTEPGALALCGLAAARQACSSAKAPAPAAVPPSRHLRLRLGVRSDQGGRGGAAVAGTHGAGERRREPLRRGRRARCVALPTGLRPWRWPSGAPRDPGARARSRGGVPLSDAARRVAVIWRGGCCRRSRASESRSGRTRPWPAAPAIPASPRGARPRSVQTTRPSPRRHPPAPSR